MIDFWKTDILTKWHIPYVTMVGRRQFNIPISSEMVIFLPGHSSSLKIMIHSNFFAVGQTRYSCSFRFLCARLHTVIIRFLHLISQNFVKNESRNAQFSINPLSCAGAILKNRPVCYGTSRLKNRVCAVTRYALLKTPTLKSNKR